MKSVFLISLILAAWILVAQGQVTNFYDQETLARIRCSTDGQEVYFAWTGTVWTNEPNIQQENIFNVVGVNVARCFKNHTSGDYTVSSREVEFYIDAYTGLVIDRFTNFNGVTVPVVHVANDPVEIPLPFGDFYPGISNVLYTTFPEDVGLTYPNPVPPTGVYAPYSAGPLYQATEFYKFTLPTIQLAFRPPTDYPDIAMSWFRTSQWLPWMKLGTRPGNLLFVVEGFKYLSFTSINTYLQQLIRTRCPLFEHAPTCVVSSPASQTSWTYFVQHFSSYQAAFTNPAIVFPLYVSSANDVCGSPN